jgi:VanZ family protein
MGLGFLLAGTKSTSMSMALLDLLLLASVTDILQLFIEGRAALWGDVAIDIAGGGAGIFVFLILSSFLKKRRLS